MIKATTELGACQVRSGTELPCRRPAAVKIRGVPFCQPCAREQEAYFVIGELTEAPSGLSDEPLVELLDRVRHTDASHGGTHANEPDAA